MLISASADLAVNKQHDHLHIENHRQSLSSAISLSLHSVFLFAVKLSLPFLLSRIINSRVHVERDRDNVCGIGRCDNV